MRKIIIFLSAVILVSCSIFGNDPPAEADLVAENFVTGITTQDIDILMSAYHEDAVFYFTITGVTEEQYEGKEVIRAGQEAGMDDPPPDSSSELISEKIDTDLYEYKVSFFFDDLEFQNTLNISLIDDAWGIITQWVVVDLPEN